jgi:hypothetical protein
MKNPRLPQAPLLRGLLLCALLGGAASAAAAASTGLAYLKIGAGARAVAMGNAVVSQVDDASATYWNPGALPLLSGIQAELMHNESFQSVRYEFASLTRRMGRHGVGAAFHGVWTDNLRSYDESGEYLGEFGYSGIAVSGSYGFAVTPDLGVGMGVEYVREQIDVDDASGVAFSFGAQKREFLPRTDVGIAVRHLGSSVKYVSQNIDLPVTVQGGVSHWLPLNALNAQLVLAVEAEAVRDEDTRVLFGAEYRYQDFTRLQVGYRTGLDTQDVSMGFGVGRDRLQAQYAFVPFGENLGDQHRFSILLHF